MCIRNQIILDQTSFWKTKKCLLKQCVGNKNKHLVELVVGKWKQLFFYEMNTNMLVPCAFCVSSTSGTTPYEEERMWKLGISKARQIHTNVTKILLRIQEEVTTTPKKPAHAEVIDQLKGE